MLQTDAQRRWWFANDPEYSSSPTGRKVSPESVDAYVDEHLQYVSGPVAVLLKAVKRNFGTVGASENGESHVDPAFRIAQLEVSPDFGLRTTPTLDDLLRMRDKPLREFLRWYDKLPQQFPMLIDPNALEKHHELVREFAKYFAKLDFEIKDFIEILTFVQHRQKGTGVHSRKGAEKRTGRGGDWNAEWRKFIEDNPIPTPMSESDKEALRGRVQRQREEMRKRYPKKE
ncbi:MAG: hypothetical protein AB1646_17585 [Thermodesulfobacteriota bacterium]